MKEITREQIDQAIEEVGKRILLGATKQFLDLCEEIPEESKNNPMAYHVIAANMAQFNAVNVMREVLYKLLAE